MGIVIDVSGSTKDPFGGSPTGDVNNDGTSNSILDAEIASIIAVLQSIAKSPDLDNSNVDIGLVTFSTVATYHGRFSPLDPNDETKVNPTLLNVLTGLKANGYTNFDGALDEILKYYIEAPKLRDNLLFFLSDGIPNVPGNGDGEVAPRDSRGNIQYINNDPSATNFVSELKALDSYKVIRLSVGVGTGTNVSPGSGLDKIDNTPDELTGVKAQQVTTSQDLASVLLRNPVVGYVIDLTITVNGVKQPNIDVSQLSSGFTGYSFGTYFVDGLKVGSNTISCTVIMDYDKNISTTTDQQTLTTFTNVIRTA